MAFAATKFLVPRLRADTVQRPDLVGPLVRDVLSVPLTVVRGPAGYGKTTLAAMLAGSPKLDDCRWLSVDADDNDPARFLAALGATLGPDLAAGAEAVLAAAGSPDATNRATTALLNAITETRSDLVIVLDEWEVITEPMVQSQLRYLVERASANLHLLLTTRQDPPIGLPRLRARGLLAERGPDDLRFSRADADALLNGSLRLGLPDRAVDEMHRRTEGWPTALRLLANSWTGDPAALPLRAHHPHVFALLADEVFDHQPADIQRFLLETSVLTTLTGPAAAAVTGRPDAAGLLDQLANQSLFLSHQGWQHQPERYGDDPAYRYHPLFAEFLHRRLSGWPAADRAALHRRAADTEADPLAAVRHLLDADDPGPAAELLASTGAAQLRLGRAITIRELLDRLDRLDRLDPGQRDRPELWALAGELAFAGNDLVSARAAFERAVGAGGEVTVRLATTLVLVGELASGNDLIGRALREPRPAVDRVRLLLTHAWAAELLGTVDVARRSLAEAVELAVDPDTIAAATAQMIPTLMFIPGAADYLERFAELARRQLPAGLQRLEVDGLAASLDLFRGRLDQARETADRMLAEYTRFGGASATQGLTLAMVRLLAAGSGANTAEPAIAELIRIIGLIRTAAFVPNLWFMIGRARWQRGELDQAREARARMEANVDPAPGIAAMAAMHRISLDGLIAIAAGDHRRAEELLRQAVLDEDDHPLINAYGSARIRLAYLYTEQGRSTDALDTAAPALAECQQLDLSGRILLEDRAAVPVLRLAAERSSYAAGLLRQLEDLAGPRPISVPGTAEVLTTRELEVLRLLTSGATNRQIAQQLFLGEETVKTHVARVLRKLGVRTRTAAASKARELGLI